MKKLLFSLGMLVFMAAPIFSLGSAAAVDVFQTCKTTTTHVCQDVKSANPNQNEIVHFISIAINIVSYVIGIAAVVGIIVAGLRFILANGDSNEIASARSGLIYALVGIVIAAVAQSIVVFVLNRL